MKTRAFDPETKQWRTDYVVMPDGDVYATEEGLFYPCLPVYKTDWKLSRFTGLLDKNGKEIYEDDIVDVDVSGYGGKYEIVWIKCTARFAIRAIDTDRYGEAEWTIDDRKCTVIGNIFTTPELLEV